MAETTRQRIKRLITAIYEPRSSETIAQAVFDRLDQLKAATIKPANNSNDLFHQEDVILITYGDMLKDAHHNPLKNLLSFYQSQLHPYINTIHILPFFPYSSDDGFSIIDYKKVNPDLGNWDDIKRLKDAGSHLMFDAVINHISAQSEWFQKFLDGDPKYQDYFITIDPEIDLSLVTRPRSLPLLTAFDTSTGKKYVWTTFSADQIDLNFANPEVLLEIVDVILFYIEHGADLIRLDAIAYLWKELGTTCIHLGETHAFVKLLRAIFDDFSPKVLLITETNVPHDENISYFGNGTDETHMVYQFSLPPLTAHALIAGSTSYLTDWATSLEYPSPQTTFFNFTASHDGVGVRPVTGILPEEDISLLLERTRAHGGKISSKTNQDGSSSPYELNINYFDLLNNPDSEEPQTLQVDRFMASQAIMLMLKGVPGIYFHSLVGSRNDDKGVEESGHARSINREKLEMQSLLQDLSNPGTLRHEVFKAYKVLLNIRTQEKAFHPSGDQKVLNLGQKAFAILRTAPNGHEKILALQNVSSEKTRIEFSLKDIGLEDKNTYWLDLISLKKTSPQSHQFSLMLQPYQTAWLKQKKT